MVRFGVITFLYDTNFGVDSSVLQYYVIHNTKLVLLHYVLLWYFFVDRWRHQYEEDENYSCINHCDWKANNLIARRRTNLNLIPYNVLSVHNSRARVSHLPDPLVFSICDPACVGAIILSLFRGHRWLPICQLDNIIVFPVPEKIYDAFVCEYMTYTAQVKAQTDYTIIGISLLFCRRRIDHFKSKPYQTYNSDKSEIIKHSSNEIELLRGWIPMM